MQIYDFLSKHPNVCWDLEQNPCLFPHDNNACLRKASESCLRAFNFASTLSQSKNQESTLSFRHLIYPVQPPCNLIHQEASNAAIMIDSVEDLAGWGEQKIDMLPAYRHSW